jgi:hypothetical protein
MSLNPLAQVKDYPSMLNRIFLFTTLSASVATWLLRKHFVWLDDLLKFMDINVDLPLVKEVKLFGYLLPGVAVGFIARTVRLHDRLSDILKIRRRFDVEEIILPLAKGSGFPVGTLSMDQLRESRSRLMPRIFYRYASSTDPKIDRHLIYEALDWWSWYWVVVESVAVFIPTGIALLFSEPTWHGWILIGACLVVSIVALPFFRSHCARYARAEVQEILADNTRKSEVNQEFRALQS